MNLRKYSKSTLGLIIGALAWTFIVILAWSIYPIKPEGWEAAGFMLLFLGLPSSMLLNFYDGSVFMQVLLMSIFGYLQWPLIGFIIGKVFCNKSKKT
jgi:hypothetical protein